MIRRLIILLLIVGCAFAQSQATSTDDKLYLLNGESYTGQFISADGKFIIFKPTGYPSGQSIEKSTINKVMLSDGTIVFTYLKEQDNNSIYTANKLTLAGKKLLTFRSNFYIGFFLSSIADVVFLYGLYKSDEYLMRNGMYVSFLGSFVTLWSFTHIGSAGEELQKAGEELIDAGEKLEAEHPEEDE